MNAVPFAARLAAVMVAVLLAASALTVSMDYLRFRRVLRTQADLVYQFVANDLAGAIEDSLNLGLPLAALQATEQLIGRRRAAEAGTLGIGVFDPAGAVLFDTDRFRVGNLLPPEWDRPRGAPGSQTEWRADLGDAYLVGAGITNAFGQPAGGVVVRYDPAGIETRMNAILLAMLRTALLALAGAGALAAAAAVLLTRRHAAWLARATAQLDAPTGVPAGPPVAGTEAVMAAIAHTGAVLDAAEAELMRLGLGAPDADANGGAQRAA